MLCWGAWTEIASKPCPYITPGTIESRLRLATFLPCRVRASKLRVILSPISLLSIRILVRSSFHYSILYGVTRDTITSVEHLLDFIIGLGVLAIAIVIFAESGLLIGFFLPGDSLLFTAGFLTQQGVLPVNIHMLVVILFVAAALGDSVGYAFGRRVGHRLFRRKDSFLFHKDNLRRAEEFYEKNGAKTIVIARFIPIIRTFAPIVAGIGKMDYRTFLLYNLIGAFLWAVGLTYLGYFAGGWIEAAGINIEYAIIAIIIISLLPAIYHVLKEPSSRAYLRHLPMRIKKYLSKN